MKNFIMNGAQKQIISQTCKGHTKFTDREFGRTCPSRLSKRELENLYFSLLDNNLELKQTINSQNEKIKQLSTRVQRLSHIQKTSLGRNERECCVNEKVVIKEQKEIIADQKRAIDRLSERVKILNMRLCSAKQFLGRNPVRCNKCCLGANISVKNSTISGLNSANKKSTSNLQTTGTSNDIIQKNSPDAKSMEVQTDYQDGHDGQKLCDENKCKTLMEELKRKIIDLEEELSNAHEDYLKRVGKLEQEVLTLRQSNGEKHFTLQQSEGQMGQLMQRLRTAEINCDGISHQLSMEKRKVSELETRLKAADLSAQVAKTVENYLRSKNMTKLRADYETSSLQSDNVETEGQAKVKATGEPKNSDDSGYMEAVLLDERKSPAKDLNSELRDKILDLQTQLNSLKRLAALEKDKRLSNFEPYEMAIEDDQVSLLRSINDYSNMTKASPIVVEPNCNKSGDVCEIKRPESLTMQPNVQESFNIRASIGPQQVPVTTPFDVTNPVVTYKTNSLENYKGILDKTDVILKAQKKEEKVPKNVSYEDFNLHSPKNTKKDCEVGEHNPRSFLGRASSDEKHNVKIDQGSSTSYLIEKISTKKDDRDDHIKLSSDHTRRSYDFKSDKRNEKKLDYDNLPHYYEDQLGDKVSSVKEHIGKGGKKISIDLPESDLDLKKPFNIEVIKSDSSYDRTPKSPPVIPFPENGEMKVLKDEMPSMDLNVPKVEKADNMKKKSVSNAELNITNQSVKKTDTRPAVKVDKCMCRTRICACPLVHRRDVNVYRTGSGTARFETITTSAFALRQCQCCPKGAQMTDCVACASQTPQCHNLSGGTYVVGAPSPRDTDGEISGMTDLPDERDESPRNVLSPGEERPTLTTTWTSTTDMTLSEGELPVSGGGRKLLSPGERKWKHSSGEMSPEITTSQRMEVALQAVSEELARCRQMLQRQRPQAWSSREVSLMTESMSDSITLSKVEGQERIVSDHSHSCRFTLHIGNIILSDQAVSFARGRSLTLAWRFYDQPPAMTRMTSGRVLHFDFTTEYRLPVTSHFLEYMRKDKIPITICEIEKSEEALANCSLPLSGALQHVNRRVYHSLTLVASPVMLGSRETIDTMDPGDEVGVIDVWCRLKVGSAVLPTIRKDSHQSPDVTATPSAAEEKPSASNATPITHRDVVQKILVSSAQDVRRAVAREIQSPSKLRILLRDLSDSNSIYSVFRNNKRKMSKKISEGQKKSVTIEPERNQLQLLEARQREMESKIPAELLTRQTLEITVVWLALKEGCDAMSRKDVQRLYVAYSFLGREGAEMETPVSLPKPKNSMDKCYFNFKKTFQLNEYDLPVLEHMVKCKLSGIGQPSHRDCLTFTVISEPPDDPLSLATCEDIGYAHLYLGDMLSRCESSDSYTDVVSVKGAHTSSACGVLAVRVAGLQALKNLW